LGPPTEAALQVASVGGRLVQIGGSAAWQEIRLPAYLLRSKSLSIFGHGSYQASFERRSAAYQRMTELAAEGKLIVPVECIPLQQVEQAWERQRTGTRQRLVLMP
jgi:NADPH2:quinone reductase